MTEETPVVNPLDKLLVQIVPYPTRKDAEPEGMGLMVVKVINRSLEDCSVHKLNAQLQLLSTPDVYCTFPKAPTVPLSLDVVKEKALELIADDGFCTLDTIIVSDAVDMAELMVRVLLDRE